MTGSVDLIIGLPSYNEEDSISFVTRQVDLGAQKYLPGLKVLIINSDSGSTDGTKDAFLTTETKCAKEFRTTAEIKSGKGTALRYIFQRVQDTGAKYAIVVDTDLRSITPEWVRSFALTVLQGYDLVVPRYLRHRFDGTITNMICYPIVFGMFGMDIRQPIGGDFAFSRKAAEVYLAQPWVKSTYQYGIDIYMTTQAILHGLKICQVDLGLKLHKPSAPKLNLMFEQVILTLLKAVREANGRLASLTDVQHIPIIPMRTGGEVEPLEVKKADIIHKCQELWNDNNDIFRKYLPTEFYSRVSEELPKGTFHISQEEWAVLVYTLMAQYMKEPSSSIVHAFKLVYFLRIAAFIDQAGTMKDIQAERLIADQARLFWETRDKYLEMMRLTPAEADQPVAQSSVYN